MKSHLWLLAISFVPFAIFGFLFSQLMNPGMQRFDHDPTTFAISSSNLQMNILLVTIDSDIKPYPRLESIWGLFFLMKDQYAAEFIPLYPSNDPLKDAILISNFFLTPDMGMDGKFLALTKGTFQIEWNAFVLIDQKEFIELLKYLNVDHSLQDIESPATSSSLTENGLLTKLCSFLKSNVKELDLLNILNNQVMDHNFTESFLFKFENWIDSGLSFNSCDIQQ
jgi:hypothetical protein